MRTDPKRYYTVMFVPDGEGRPFSVRVHRNIVRSAVGLVAFSAAALVFFLVIMGRVGVRLQLVDALGKERARLEAQNDRLVTALATVHALDDVSEYLDRLASLTAAPSPPGANGRVAQPDSGLGKGQETRFVALGEATAEPIAGGYLAATPTMSPVDGWTTRGFSAASPGGDPAGGHPGIDVAAATGTPVRATAPGIVANVTNHPSLGLLVEIEHAHEFTTRYGHCSQVLVSKGQAVERGLTIALVGNTGRSTAPHLHYEVIRRGVAQDPAKYIFGAGSP